MPAAWICTSDDSVCSVRLGKLVAIANASGDCGWQKMYVCRSWRWLKIRRKISFAFYRPKKVIFITFHAKFTAEAGERSKKCKNFTFNILDRRKRRSNRAPFGSINSNNIASTSSGLGSLGTSKARSIFCRAISCWPNKKIRKLHWKLHFLPQTRQNTLF